MFRRRHSGHNWSAFANAPAANGSYNGDFSHIKRDRKSQLRTHILSNRTTGRHALVYFGTYFYGEILF